MRTAIKDNISSNDFGENAMGNNLENSPILFLLMILAKVIRSGNTRQQGIALNNNETCNFLEICDLKTHIGYH